MTESNFSSVTSRKTSSQKYDRQIRIWGDHGQSALSSSSVCLINATSLGTEVLKNLVLPGIGSVTVIDGSDVSTSDHGNNFFVTCNLDSKSVNRAHATASALQQLNPDVSVAYIPHHIHSFINSSHLATVFFRNFSAVIVTQLPSKSDTLMHIADGCFRANIPLIVLRVSGFVGMLRLQVRELGFVETKLESLPPDLRIHEPFDQLETYVNSIDLQNISDSTQAAHIPYVIILTKAVQLFKQKYGNRLPNTREEKTIFKQIVNSLRPKSCPEFSQNFEEALKPFSLSLCYSDASNIPSDLQQLLRDTRSDSRTTNRYKSSDETQSEIFCTFPETIRLSRTSSNTNIQQLASGAPSIISSYDINCGTSRIATDAVLFWLHLSGVRAFLTKYDRLPVSGTLPDMTADTESFTVLQRIYSEQAKEDAKEVLGLTLKAAEYHGSDASPLPDEASIQNFCRNIRGAKLFTTRSLRTEIEGGGGFSTAALSEGALEASGTGCASPYYFAIRVCDTFAKEHGRIPGSDPSQRDADLRIMMALAAEERKCLGLKGNSGLWNEQIDEVVRYAGTEIHTVSAFIGGVAAQEITKILTKQFVPVQDTIVFNFAEQTSIMFDA